MIELPNEAYTYVPLPYTRIAAHSREDINIVSQRKLRAPYRLYLQGYSADERDLSPGLHVDYLTIGQTPVASAPGSLPIEALNLTRDVTYPRQLIGLEGDDIEHSTRISISIENNNGDAVIVSGALFGCSSHPPRWTEKMTIRLDNALKRITRPSERCEAVFTTDDWFCLHKELVCLLPRDHSGDHYARGIEWA